MKPTRRGFVGLVGGVVGAAVAGVKLTPAEAGVVKGAAKELHTIAPTFKIDTRTGPPWAVGDVVKRIQDGEMFYIRHAEPARVRNNTIFGMRGTGINVIEREAAAPPPCTSTSPSSSGSRARPRSSASCSARATTAARPNAASTPRCPWTRSAHAPIS